MVALSRRFGTRSAPPCTSRGDRSPLVPPSPRRDNPTYSSTAQAAKWAVDRESSSSARGWPA